MIDRLVEKIEERNCAVVVGLDPTPEMLPEKFLDEAARRYGETPEAVAYALLKYNKQVIDAVADIVPAVKPQIAFYERLGEQGIRAYRMTCEYAAGQGLIVIGDIKRGDIGSTAAAYAAHLKQDVFFGKEQDVWNEDAITINPYLGGDSIEPFLEVLRERDKGVFVLVKTSNPGSSDIQDLLVNDEEFLYERVARLVAEWGAELIGKNGYSKVGAVVGATHPEIAERLRTLMPHTFFLLPGYGAQGATAADAARFFDKKGGGCIVNSSRGIIAAWQKEGEDAGKIGRCARAAAIKMRDEINAALLAR